MNLTALRLAVPALALALFATAAFAWSSRKVEGSGTARTETRAVAGFTSLAVAVPGDTEITQGSSETLSITADDNVLAEIETVVEGKVLKVRFKKGVNVHTRTKMKLVLGVKTLESIAISGSGDVRAGPLRAEALSVSISGSGDARFEKLDAKSLAVKVAGSGDFAAAGKVDAVSLSIAGSGNVKAAKLESKSVQLNVAGSGDATVWASDTIKMRVVGSGGVKYYGNPTVDQTVVGSGNVTRLGATPG